MSRVERVKGILWTFAVLGSVAIVIRLYSGLGAVTDLSDGMPWGLWKILNMVAGVALATGGFVMAAAVYVFGMERYRSVFRTAVVVAFLGYGSSCFALFLDIGLPHRIWAPLLFWNHHSILFEVAWCVMLYFTITAMEVTPLVLKGSRLARLLHRGVLPMVVIGITLSSLHHTSLGSLFLAMPARLHPLWFTSGLPLLFIVSAIGAGMQLVVLAVLFTGWLYRTPFPRERLEKISIFSGWILGLGMILKLGDLLLQGKGHLLFDGTWECFLFQAETAFGGLLPAGLLLLPTVRNKRAGLAAVAILAVGGLLLNRLNVGIFGLIRTSGSGYFPTLPEFLISLGVLAFAGLAYLHLVERFSIFEGLDPDRAIGFQIFSENCSPFHAVRPLARTSLIVVLAAPVALACLFSNATGENSSVPLPVRPPRGMDENRSVLFIDGDRDGNGVFFSHEAHRDRQDPKTECHDCHHADLPDDRAPSCSRCHRTMERESRFFRHDRHILALGDKWSCGECHPEGRTKTAEEARLCADCHFREMGSELFSEEKAPLYSPAYKDAMHGTCMKCHRERDKENGAREKGECDFCHGSPNRELMRR